MNVSDFLLDLNDLWGRVVPGFVLLADCAVLAMDKTTFKLTCIFDPQTNLLLSKDGHSLLTLLLVVFLSYILGELSLWPIFRTRDLFIRKNWKIKKVKVLSMDSPYDIMKNNISRCEPVTDYFKAHFPVNDLTTPGEKIFKYCKIYLQAHCNDLYIQSKKNEARSNLHGGMIIPMIFTIITMLIMWWPGKELCQALVFIIIPTLLFVFHFFSFFYRMPRKEHVFVYLAYFWCSSGHGSSGKANISH